MRPRLPLYTLPIALLIPLLILTTACGDDDPASPVVSKDPELLRQVDYGCVSSAVPSPKQENCSLTRAIFRSDTLILAFRFRDQCCAHFETSHQVEGGRLTIAVEDTTRSRCDCICNFEEEFTFLVTARENLPLRFQAAGCDLDTVLIRP
jgi:hypothetical protein